MPDLRLNAPNRLSVGAPPQTLLGELFTALHRLPSWILGGLLLREERGGDPDPLLSRYTPSTIF